MPLPRALAAFVAAAAIHSSALAAELDIPAIYFEVGVERPPTLSNLDPVPEDLARAGAELAQKDIATTGRFLGHKYSLDSVYVEPGEDPLPAAREALAQAPFLILNAPAEALLAIADLPEASGALLFNASAPERALRDAECRANLLHTIASHDERADALMQFLTWKRWTDLALIVGPEPADMAFGQALRRSAAKFGLEIGAEAAWSYDTDLRRSASGEVPLLTQGLGDYDILLVADETDGFGQYILYNTWSPRPVAGSDGLAPVTWSGALEQWGAAQLQGRFEAAFERDMRSEDYAAWLAVRAIGEAVTRMGTSEPAALRAFLLSDEFRLDGFKGRALSFRSWNGQARQPIPLVHPHALVTLAPVEGFLHQRSEMDTLGLDEPESACAAFAN